MKLLPFFLTFALLSVEATQPTPCGCSDRKEVSLPTDQARAYQCRIKIRTIANQMRSRVENLVRETVPGMFKKIETLRNLYPYIDLLERIGIDCCARDDNSDCCAEPLVQQLQVWDIVGLREE